MLDNKILNQIQEKGLLLSEKIDIEYEVLHATVYSDSKAQILSICENQGQLQSAAFDAMRHRCELYSFVDQGVFNRILSREPSQNTAIKTELHPTDRYSKYYFKDGWCMINETRSTAIVCLPLLKKYFIIKPSKQSFHKNETVRVFRHLLRESATYNDGILLHSATVCRDGKGILILGQSGSGKTSTLLNLLGQKNTHLVANDKTIIFCKENKLHSIGLSFSVNITQETASKFPAIHKYIKSKNLRLNDRNKFPINNSALAEIMGTEVKHATTISMVILPQYTLGQKDNQWTFAQHKDVVNILNDKNFIQESHVQKWTDITQEKKCSGSTISKVCTMISSLNIPIVSIKGGDTFSTFQAWNEIDAALKD